MYSKDIRLTDGSILNVKINYYTIYLMNKEKIHKKTDQLDRLEEKIKNFKNKKDPHYLKLLEKKDDVSFGLAGMLIYIILKSNNRKEIDFEDALMLCPADPEEIKTIIDEFQKRMDKYKKKQGSKMKNMTVMK